jgi:hypothetical protein
MFPAEVYKKRRQKLKELLPEGVILFPGNREVPYNYPPIHIGSGRIAPFLTSSG